MHEPSAEALIEAVALQRDRAAFAALFRRFAPRLKAFAVRGGMAPADADAVVQETMLAVWAKAALFDRRRASAATWMFTILRNKRIELFRRERRPQVDPEDPALRGPIAEDASEGVAAAELSAALLKRLDSLPAEQADIVRRAFWEEKSHAQIAAECGLPLGTVKSRIRLALNRLRVLMTELNA
ncbi:MAG: sigma-70 family RNA polymerase sigma factor [Rhodospirillales bacterium]